MALESHAHTKNSRPAFDTDNLTATFSGECIDNDAPIISITSDK